MQDTEGSWDRWLVADVVCHELAHQWFGNAVTAADWDNIVINEVSTHPFIPPTERVALPSAGLFDKQKLKAGSIELLTRGWETWLKSNIFL